MLLVYTAEEEHRVQEEHRAQDLMVHLCIKGPLNNVQVKCKDVRIRHCIQVPEVMEVAERVPAQKCKVSFFGLFGVILSLCQVHIQEECREAVLELPKQACSSGLEGDLSKPTLKL